ncbi:MAG TPA: relaxase/mobilization nuclease domain-containing protein [Sphingomicrobium sp.]|nr:relaxase/mobilization nuclease domain-containing protein [Sphingomicrobium sp.]
MIAKTSSGRRFAALGDYLARGRSGTETDRVAWTASRNLGTDDPQLAAALMQATARQSAAVQTPVYHLTISFDPGDRVTPEQIQAVADRVLRDLGLAAHQALMVAHNDRVHAHVHIMVNRVHPETGVAWERWKDRPVIERALREEERALGLREVAGRLAPAPEREAAATVGNAVDGSRRLERIQDRAFDDRVRALLPELRAACSWNDLQATLAAHGLRTEGKGQGLVITDGEHEVKASRVGRDLSLRRLEERFGTPYPNREQLNGSPTAREARLGSAAAEIAATAREYERVDALTRQQGRVEQELELLHAQRLRFEHSAHSVARAHEAFDRALQHVFRDPAAAAQQVRTTERASSANEVERLLRDEPQRFGALRTTDRPRAFGLLIADDDSSARASARSAAIDWRTLNEREAEAAKAVAAYVQTADAQMRDAFAAVYRAPSHAVPAFEQAVANAGSEAALDVLAKSPDRFGSLRSPGTPAAVARLDWADLAERARRALEARAVTSSELAREHTERAIGRAEGRRRDLRAAIDGAPRQKILRTSLNRAVRRLEPNELRALRTVLTSPQSALLFKARSAVRDAALGRDEPER